MGATAAVAHRPVGLVGGAVEAQARREPPAGVAQRQRDLAEQVGAAALDLVGVGMHELVDLGLQRPLQRPAARIAPARTGLRRALVGRDDAGARAAVLQQLPALHPGIELLVDFAQRGGAQAAALFQPAAARQQPRRQRFGAAQAVLPVVAVRDPQQAPVVAQAAGRGEGAALLRAQRPALLAGLQIVGQREQIGLAAPAGLQVAVLGLERRAALAHQRGRERHVLLGRDVPVIGRRHAQAGGAGGADHRRQPAGLARVGDRKAHHRQRQDRHALEAQHRAFGQALVGVEVQPHPPGAEFPGRRLAVDQIAAAVAGPAHHHAVAADEVDPLGTSARLGAAQVEARRQEVALLMLGLQVQLGAEKMAVLALQPHRAERMHPVVVLAVLDAVGLQRQQAAAQRGPSFRPQRLAGLADQAIGLDQDRILAAGCRLGRGLRRVRAHPGQLQAALAHPGRRGRAAGGLLGDDGRGQAVQQQADAGPGHRRERSRARQRTRAGAGSRQGRQGRLARISRLFHAAPFRP